MMKTMAEPTPEARRTQTLLLLRWVLIIATSYLLLFSHRQPSTPGIALFVAGYFASNLVLTWLLPRVHSRHSVDIGVILFDTAVICLGLALSGNASSDFFLLYFLIVFLAALTERLGLVVAAAVLASVVHLTTVAQFAAPGDLIQNGYLLRIPFVLVVALFFGHLVQEETQARERVRLESVSAVSHDLKSPLWVIQSIAELLLVDNAGPLNADQAQLVRRIHANSRHLITLSHNLLSVTRIESGRLTLQRAPESLNRIVQDAVDLARCASELKGVTLKFAPALWAPLVLIDSASMERVVTNLLDNAIKFTPRGGTVTAAAAQESDQLLLRISDDGPGIPAAELPTLFEKYHRRARSSREGSGFGLFIVRAIVDAHGGTVSVESTVGQGTTMTVRLPLGPGETERAHRGSPSVRSWWRWLRNAHSTPVLSSPRD